MKQVIDLSGRTILVTGASSGIGAQTAQLLSQLGARVLLVARNEEKLRDVAGRLEGEGHLLFPFDLSQLDEIEGFIKSVIERSGPVDGFVHSAGITDSRPIKLLKPDSLEKVMTLNFYAFVEICRCITKRNCFREGLSIVGISSISSVIGNQAKLAYCASKAAVDAAVRCIAKELAPKGVRANTVCPGIIETEMFIQMKQTAGDSADAVNKIGRQYLGTGKPIDVANAIAYLLSDASRLMTGTQLRVDGGMLSS